MNRETALDARNLAINVKKGGGRGGHGRKPLGGDEDKGVTPLKNPRGGRGRLGMNNFF